MDNRIVSFSTDTFVFIKAALELVYPSCGSILMDGLFGVIMGYINTTDVNQKSVLAAEGVKLLLDNNSVSLNLSLNLSFGVYSIEIGGEVPYYLSLSLSYMEDKYSLHVCEARSTPLESRVTPGIMKEAEKKGLNFKLVD